MILVAVLFLPVVTCWLWMPRVVALTALERLAAATAFGLALPSTAFFLLRFASVDVAQIRVIDPVAWTALAFMALALGPPAAQAATRGRTRASSWMVLAALATILAAVFIPYVADRTTTSRAGDWDAWAIWNLRARFLAAAGSDWTNGFLPVLWPTHPDYPLLVPGVVARAWAVSGSATPAAPALVAFMATATTAAAVVGSLAARAGGLHALCALLLLVVPGYVHLSTAQQADIFVGLFTVLAVVLMAAPTTRRSMAAAGLALGMAAWSKNEGLTIALGAATAFLLARHWSSGGQRALRDAGWLAAGLAPMLVVLIFFKLALAPTNDLASRFSLDTLTYWTDLPRVYWVVAAMAKQMVNWGGWPLVGPLCFIPLVVIALPRGARRTRHAAVHTAFLALAGQFMVFFAVYVMTHETPQWQLPRSWDRLILQMWPATVWWACAGSMPDDMHSSVITPAAAPHT